MEVKIRKDIVKTDYLIIGGGVAGLQSAITAAALGVDVLIAEKGRYTPFRLWLRR